ncbi:MAG: helix-turn-helix domain-containing protein [Bacillota bacterium]|nr:helix-turn-helix domain-containing protein [Bacillota bacterium]
MRRIEGVSERVLECAKEEFFAKGFQQTSIREIAKKADTSPRSIYTRFPNKEGLFDAIVTPYVDALVQMYVAYQTDFWANRRDMTDEIDLSTRHGLIYVDMMDYIYDHREAFLLIMNSLDGSRLVMLVERLATTDLSFLHQHVSTKLQPVSEAMTAHKMMRILSNSFYSALFEPLRYDMTRREARYYIERLCLFFVAGIQSLRQEESPPDSPRGLVSRV